jgi:hypothetical protein
MAEAEITNDVVTTEPQAETEVSFEAFSKLRKEGKIIGNEGGTERNSGGDQWDGERNEWVNTAPRDSQGRFSKVRESLAQSQRKTEYIQALQAGAVEPNDDMSPEEWALARNRMLANGTNVIKTEFPAEEKPAGEAEGGEQAIEEPLTPEQIKHNEAHEALHTRILAKLEAPEVKQLTKAMEYAVERGATPYFFDTLGNIAADFENSEAVLYHLGENPEKLAAFSFLTPDKLKGVMRTLSQQLDAQQKPAAPPKPKPPAPVGARASASAFDVNDESLSADEWARQRNESLARRGRH